MTAPATANDKTTLYGRAQRDISLVDGPQGNALDLLRTRKTADARTLSLDDGPHQQEAVSANTAEPATEIRDWLRQALGRLNPRWAEMFVLRFIEDYSNREIAAMMNTSAAVVAVVLHRTRAQLKKDFRELARGRR